MSKPFLNSSDYPERTHELLEVVRLLENKHHLNTNTTLIFELQTQDGTPFDKLVRYAIAQDTSNTLQTTLTQTHHKFALLGVGLSWLAFVLGAVASFGFLQSEWLNFFYLLIASLGWHTVSLILWLIGQGRSFGSPLVAGAIESFLNKAPTLSKNPINEVAWQVFAQTTTPKRAWLIGKLVHRAWIFSLLGSVVALFLLFLSKSYAFVWESTLLSQSHIHTIVQIIGIVPSWFGLDLSADLSNQQLLPDPAKLATLLMLAIVLYGIVPRLLAYLYCHLRASRVRFHIDGNLYYYENLIRQFKKQIVNPDDYIAPTAKPAQAKVSTAQKLALTFERTPADPFWYQFGAGANVLDFGVLDNTDDFIRLEQELQVSPLSLYVGIDTQILPDRGVVRKFEKLLALAKHGMVVELLGEPNTHHSTWQEVLIKYGIDEVRYR